MPWFCYCSGYRVVCLHRGVFSKDLRQSFWGYTVIITIVAVRRVSKRISMFGLGDEEKRKAVFCQIFAPLSIIVVLFIITGILDNVNKKINKKK